MEKEPKIEKSQIPFDVGSLIDSNISEKHKNFHKFFESKDSPDKIIRVESFDELKYKHKNRFELIELVEIAKQLFNELQEKYGINVPVEFFIGKNKEGREIVYSVVDKIEGKHLDEVENHKEASEKIKKLYTSIAKYFLDKSKEDGLYIWDICSQSQYVYGKKLDDTENNIYLIDTDIWLNNSKTEIYLVVYWLTRHMSVQEKEMNTKFDEARNYIKQFVEEILPKNISDNDIKNVDGIKDFLNDKVSNYNPKSAIPKFE